MKRFISLLYLCLITAVLTVNAQTGKPSYILQQYADMGIVSHVSDNGKWAIVKGATTEQWQNGLIRIINTETKEETILKTADQTDDEAKGIYVAADITDDGKIVVGGYSGRFTNDGSFLGKPAYFNVETKTWTELPMPDNVKSAEVTCVTPDGHYAVGVGEDNAENLLASNSHGIMWDLQTNSIVELKNLPNMPQDYSCLQERFTQISADGRYIVIYGNQSIAPASFIYDRETETYMRFGRDGNNTPANFMLIEIAPYISANGKYVTATIRDTEDNLYVCLYNMETKMYTSFNSTEDLDMLADYVDNYGNIYASSPASTPVREWKVMSENIWYPFSLICSQRYGVDFYESTGFDNSGTLWAGSADGQVLASMVSPLGESYILTMPEPMAEACRAIDLLQEFTATPSKGASFSSLETVSLRFNHVVKALGKSNTAVLKDSEGKTVRNSMAFKVSNGDNHTIIVTFRATKLNDGEDYTIVIPAGSISLEANENKINSEIVINYHGRDNKPVSVAEYFPEQGAEIARIDNSSNFPILTFDIDVKTTDNAAARLIEVTSDGDHTISSLSVVCSSANKKQVALLPAATQYLYAGATYKVVLDAGSVTDLTGAAASANKEVVINYTGTYERTVSGDDVTIFSEDFNDMASSLASMMRYEGDHNTPTADMQAWAFDADNQPWNLSIREDNTSTDICAASTSMYSPAGQSDDWMSTPQLNIPDAFCTLTFDAQKYLDLYDDKLNVVIWPCDENINYLTSDIIARMKSEGDVHTYDLSIGETEEGLSGEWQHFAIDLAKYEGKKIYIAFWNNNNNQSVVFLDNILVMRNLKYLVSLINPASVVNKQEQTISGAMMINSDVDTYSEVTLTLNDSEGKTVDTFHQSGLALKKGDIINFAFETPLPLTVGEVNNFTIGIKLDNYTDVMKSSISDLTFEPVKRVVLEEMTGTTCPNCPRGILGIENLERIFGDKFIPISLHTYSGDPYSSTLLEKYTQTLGLLAAPTGMVQRNGNVIAPMGYDLNGNNTFSNGSLWQDAVAAEMDVPTYVGVSVPEVSLSESGDKINMTVEIQSALNMKNQYINVFPIALEDGLVNSQVNNLYNETDPIFGEWGKGGKYSYSNVSGITNNDVARLYWGEITGTNIGFPQKLEAGQSYSQPLSLSYPSNLAEAKNGKIVLMVMDGNAGVFLNAITVPFSRFITGIDDAVAGSEGDVEISLANGTVNAVSNGNISLSVYSASGTLLGRTKGNGSVRLSIQGYRGTAIVKAVNANGVTTKKVVL